MHKLLRLLTEKQLILVRHKSSQKKVLPKEKALEHFDEFYLQIFGQHWPSIRKGLLGKQRYVAVVNNYSDIEQITSTFEKWGALNMRAVFQLKKQYLQEDSKNIKRDRYLKRIWKMDMQMEEELDKRTQEDENKIENEISQDGQLNEQIDKYKMLSLDYKLSEADFDDTRLIESSLGLSAPTLQEFMPVTRIKQNDPNWVSESEYYTFYKDGDFKVNMEKEYDFNFPEHLNIYCFEQNNSRSFPSPKRGSTGVLDYYILDGGSVLPVLALDVRPGNTVLDMCAAPGGKSLMILQTLYPDRIVCNDVSKSRTDRIFKVLSEYFYDLDDRWLKTKRIKVIQNDGRYFCGGSFDRVLVDVPCTTDRHSVKENENNIFKPTRIKERLKLPQLQTELLVNALKLVKKGGIVVYSTCSLSPIQNDGVVHMALQKLWEETGIEVVVKNLNVALAQTQDIFRLADVNIFRYGNLILPSTSQNYGPTYFCKLKRVN